MSRAPELQEIISLPPEVKQAGQRDLVLFIGAGISKLLDLPLWKELAEKVLEDLRKEGLLNYAGVKDLKSLEAKQILSISQLIDEENFRQKIAQHLEEPESKGIYETINRIGCVYVTTNYDGLLEPPRSPITDRTQTSEEVKRVYNREKIHTKLLDEEKTIIHLHGYKAEPSTMVVTTEDYLELYNHQNIQDFLEHLFKKKTVVFLGYGLEDTEILEYIFRQRKIREEGNRKHFAVQGFFRSQQTLYEKLYGYYDRTFKIELLGFVRDYEDHGAIEGIIKGWAKELGIQAPSLYTDIEFINKVCEMDKITAEEKEEVLHRIKNKPVLRPLFFRKAKGLKWFFPLKEADYFKPENLPRPSEQEGYVTIPPWEVVNYLLKTAPELDSEEGEPYRQEFLSIMEGATEYAKKNEFGNYQVWWRFSEILFHIPHNLITDKTINVVDYWLDDRYETNLVAEFIGEKWLPELLEKQDEHASRIAAELLSKLFRVSFEPAPSVTDEKRQKARLRFDDYHAKNILRAIALKVGELLGKKSVDIFHTELIRILKELKNDGWSSIWQPSIADHKQNLYHDDAENMFIFGYRESLTGFMQSFPEEAKKYLRGLLNSEYATIQRIAIYFIGQNRESYKDLWDYMIEEKFFHGNFRHETWHFLHLNYPHFTEKQKKKTLQIIQEKEHKDENGNILETASAYIRSIWLAAIKDFGEEELYQKEVKTAGAEPEHPDFSSYMTSGRGEIVHPKSSHTKDELNGMEVSDVAELLKSFRSSGEFDTPSVSGLSQSFKDAIISEPLRYIGHLDKFKDVDLSYVYSIVAAYSDLWEKKEELSWDDIWFCLLEYTLNLIEQKVFWDADSDDADNRNGYAANRNNVLKEMCRLIESGAHSDDRAFHEKHHGRVKDILGRILKNEKGEIFTKNGDLDMGTIVLNTPRGRCGKALINVALRHCRLADKKNDGNHAEAWQEFEQYFDGELKRESNINYEFFTLIPEYIPNFLYMSKEWLMENLKTIFDRSDKTKWLCAIQGYNYMHGFVPDVYQHLKSHGHIIYALDDKDLSEHSSIFVRQAVYSFLRNEESLDDENSLVNILLSRGKSDEIHEIILTVYSLRLEERNKLISKIHELWIHIQKSIKETIGFSSEEGRKLISALCLWIEFLDHLDEEKRKLLLEIAPHANSEYDFPYGLLKELARISAQQPFEVNEIWQAAISGMPKGTYGFLGSQEEIKTILENLVSKGEDGKRAAKETAAKCAEKGMFQPSEILSEILKN